MKNIVFAHVPEDYRSTLLYKTLVSKEGHEPYQVKIDILVREISPILATIGRGTFEDYTLHDSIHSRKLLHIAGYIIPNSVLESLSLLELTVIIMSCYVHDLGMVVIQQNKTTILKSQEFQTFLETNPEYIERIKDCEGKMSEVSQENRMPFLDVLGQIQDAAITKYVRPMHASIKRYKELFDTLHLLRNYPDLFSIEGTSFEEELLLICSSHNEPTSFLRKEDVNGSKVFDTECYVCNQKLNMQFCAAVLRLADILDFDRERTPSTLFRAIGIENKALPGFKISLREWNKQMATHTIRITDDNIIVNANCTNPSIEHSIRELCSYISQEISDTQNVLKNNRQEICESYSLDLPIFVKPVIRSVGYTYKDYSLKLNEKAVINILMGERLYAKSYVAARELVQNAIDACNVRVGVDKCYVPNIKVSINLVDGHRWLVVQDNGIGMDDKVLSNYFFQIGKSYYGSPDFKSFKKANHIDVFTPISRFGIGILSVFMIGDVVKVTTSNKFSADGDFAQRTLMIDSVESLAVVKETSRNVEGTKMEVLLRNDNDNDLFVNGMLGYLRDTLVRPHIPVSIYVTPDKPVVTNKNNFLELDSKIKNNLASKGIVPFVVDFSQYSDKITGFAYFFFFKKIDGKLSFVDSSGKLSWGIYPLKGTDLFPNQAFGSRVTVNGIAMTVKKIGSMFNLRKKIMPFVLDVDIVGSEKVEYDVSRTRIIGKGLYFVREEIYKAIILSFEQKGLMEQFDDDTKMHFKKVAKKNIHRTALDMKLLEKVESLLPKDEFYVTSPLICEIAAQLGEEYSYEIIKPYVYAVAQKQR